VLSLLKGWEKYAAFSSRWNGGESKRNNSWGEVFRSSEEVKAKECLNFEASKTLIWLLKLQMESRVVLSKMCNQ
jgi:hypothetical protein